MFEEAIVHILKNEGGYVDHKSDKGGATNYGISLRFLKSLGLFGDLNKDGVTDVKDINIIDAETAKAIYKKFWWDKYKYGQIKNKKIATKILDMSINIGAYRSHIIVQKSLNELFKHDILKKDGIIGRRTIYAINKCGEHRKLMVLIVVNITKYYLHLYDKDEKNRINFIVGWLKRAVKR